VEPELARYYRDLQAEAAERSHEARQKLGGLPPEQVAKVSPFLHPDELHNTALARMLNMGVDRQRAGERLWPLYISNEAMDKNPWAAAFSNIPEDASPELLRRTAQTAFGLIRQSLEHSQASYTREEADVWSGYAWVAIKAWNDAHSALRATELEQIVTPAAEFSSNRSPPETRDEMLRRHTLEAELVHSGYHIEETPAQLAQRQTQELARFAAHETEIGTGIRAEIPAGDHPTPGPTPEAVEVDVWNAYVRACGEAYQRHGFSFGPGADDRLINSLTLPEPQNAVEHAALKGWLDAVEKQIGFRPEIVFEARQTPETEATPTSAGSGDHAHRRAGAGRYRRIFPRHRKHPRQRP
jgi:hypothetical protein